MEYSQIFLLALEGAIGFLDNYSETVLHEVEWNSREFVKVPLRMQS